MISRRIAASFAALVVSTLSLHAQYTEVGDAGQTLAGVQNTGATGGNPLTSISGTIGTATDADLFRITITAPTTFSASTVNGVTTIDTALFLFTSSGAPIVTNDDDSSGTTSLSTIPAGNSFTMTLSPGVYYLGISLSGNEPINLNNQLLFAMGTSTDVRGPASGINPNALSNFDGLTGFPETGAYRIDLTSAASAVPEPATLALSTLGLLFLGARAGRRYLRRAC